MTRQEGALERLIAAQCRRTGYSKMALARAIGVDYRVMRRVARDPMTAGRSSFWERFARFLGCTEFSLRQHCLEDDAFALQVEPRSSVGPALGKLDAKARR